MFKHMKNMVTRTKDKARDLSVVLFCSAAAPAMAGSFGGVDPSDFLEESQKSAGKGLTMVGLVVGALGFLAVAYYAIAVFSEVQKGKKTWTDFGAVALVGAVMLVLVFWMLNKMGGIDGLFD